MTMLKKCLRTYWDRFSPFRHTEPYHGVSGTNERIIVPFQDNCAMIILLMVWLTIKVIIMDELQIMVHIYLFNVSISP